MNPPTNAPVQWQILQGDGVRRSDVHRVSLVAGLTRCSLKIPDGAWHGDDVEEDDVRVRPCPECWPGRVA